jgi:hypothetical protein
MKCPCEDCLIKSICKSKPYTTLIETCSLISKHLGCGGQGDIRHKKRLMDLYFCLNPSLWVIGTSKQHSFIISSAVDSRHLHEKELHSFEHHGITELKYLKGYYNEMSM